MTYALDLNGRYSISVSRNLKSSLNVFHPLSSLLGCCSYTITLYSCVFTASWSGRSVISFLKDWKVSIYNWSFEFMIRSCWPQLMALIRDLPCFLERLYIIEVLPLDFARSLLSWSSFDKEYLSFAAAVVVLLVIDLIVLETWLLIPSWWLLFLPVYSSMTNSLFF